MIQIVSAYLIKQRGIVTDNDPSHVTPSYVEKNRFKRWLLEDPLRYNQHIFIHLRSSKIHRMDSYHSATIFSPAYNQTDKWLIDEDINHKYTTLDGATSVNQLSTPTWGLIQTSIFSQMYIGNYGCETDEPISNIQYYEYRTPTSFTLESRRTQQRTAGVDPDPDVVGTMSYGGFPAEYHEQPGLDSGWRDFFYSVRIESGVPVFTSYEDGVDYCTKVLDYINNQSSANYQAACDAIDKCINP